MADTPALDLLAEFVAVQEGKPIDQARREARYAVDLFSAILDLEPQANGPTEKAPAPAPGKTSVAIYARVSTKEQAEEGFSIEAQLALLRSYCLRLQFDVSEEFVEDESAHSRGRPVFGKMLDAVRKRGLAGIVVEKTDRLYRNIADWVRIDELGVAIHLVKENEILSEESRSHQKFVHGIKVLVAKNYSDNLGEEASKGMREKARQGLWPSMAPIGYRNVQKGSVRIIEPDPNVAPIVRTLFETYARGDDSMKRLGELAGALGLRTRSGKRLTASHVHTVLRNPIHRGAVVWNGEEYPGQHEALVTPELWRRCQDVMDAKNGSLGGGFAKPEYAYRGLVSCGVCGCAASPYTAKRTYVYYACSGARGCTRHGVREEAITEAVSKVLDSLRIRQSVLDLLKGAIREGHAEVFRGHSDTLADLESRRKVASARLEQLYEDKIRGEVPTSVYPNIRARMEADLESIENEIRAHGPAHRKTWDDSLALLEAVSNSAVRFKQAKPDARRRLFKIVVSNCQIIEGKVMLTLRSEFESILKANEECGLNPALERDLENWLPDMDSNHD